MAAVTSIEVAAEGARNSDVFEFLKRPARNLSDQRPVGAREIRKDPRGGKSCLR